MASEKAAADSWRFPESFADVSNFVDIDNQNTWLCVLLVVLTPLLFNLVCTWEYNTRVFSKCFGSGKVACVFFSFFQILSSNTRNYYFKEAIGSQPRFETPFNAALLMAGYFITAIGAIFVVTSFVRLGWFGTWHGDHFGILLPEKVTGFPFNVMDHPMYDGAVLIFVGTSIGERSLVGIALAFWAQIVYRITEMVEGPFTEMIYAKAAAEKKKGTTKSH